jgi:hypothetical protein
MVLFFANDKEIQSGVDHFKESAVIQGAGESAVMEITIQLMNDY